MAELAYLLLEVFDLALEIIDLIKLPLNRVLKGNDSGRRGEDFFAQVLGDERDDRLRAVEISLEDSLTRKHWLIPLQKQKKEAGIVA